MMKAMIAFYVIDDHTETAFGDLHYQTEQCNIVYGQFFEMMTKLISPDKIDSVKMCRWKPYILAMHSIFDCIVSKYNKVQKHRMLETWTYYIEGNVMEANVINNKVKINSKDEMDKVIYIE